MNIKPIIVGTLLSALAFNAFAVDGYKNVKFGSDFATLKKANFCTWKKGDDYSVKSVDTYYCTNFKFSGEDTLAVAIFINGKFERLSINVNRDVEELLAALKAKYGEPSSTSSIEAAKKAATNGGEVYIKFDNDTIFVSVDHDLERQMDLSSLVYSSPDYSKKFSSVKTKSLEDDV
ncbi:hypothetical protein VYN02_001036 [Shigella sonnei]|nr:hypothetical protein [Shigella sonnei]EFZ7274845.1 hypothetical protein [Shigella sonnei]EKY7370475.1 hypothetical protein [Shigella sonnei]EME4986204.1 hypothetical protein [Shigella sonnei]